MSDNDRPRINGAFSGNVNSNNFVIGGDGANVYWQRFMSDIMKGHTDNGEPSKATQDRSSERRVQTHPVVPDATRSSNLSVSNVAGNPPIFPGGAIFREPRETTPEPTSEGMGVCKAPVREPPAWKLNCEIGHGSFGTVFLEKVQTRGMESPELWAVKRISRSLSNLPAKRYRDEIKNIEALSSHEWFVKFLASCEDDNYVYIAMEYIPIGDISKTFAKGYRWNESDAKVVIEQLLRGLVVMHEERITHRDLKPENIFLYLPEGEANVLRVKIGDFGTSKRIPRSDSSTVLGTSTGTQGYMAPEVQDTSKIKTNRVDIWSLGCILHRMVAGSLIFNSEKEVWKYSHSASSPPRAVETMGYSIPCRDFLRDVLQPSPGDRPSAEACLKKTWIINKGSGSEYSIGGGLYKKLKMIELEAPDVYSLSDKVTSRAAHDTSARSLSNLPTPVTGSSASTPKSSKTFGPSSTPGPR